MPAKSVDLAGPRRFGMSGYARHRLLRLSNPDLERQESIVTGAIDTGHATDALYPPQQLQQHGNVLVPMFDLENDGAQAERVEVQLGEVSRRHRD